MFVWFFGLLMFKLLLNYFCGGRRGDAAYDRRLDCPGPRRTRRRFDAWWISRCRSLRFFRAGASRTRARFSGDESTAISASANSAGDEGGTRSPAVPSSRTSEHWPTRVATAAKSGDAIFEQRERQTLGGGGKHADVAAAENRGNVGALAEESDILSEAERCNFVVNRAQMLRFDGWADEEKMRIRHLADDQRRKLESASDDLFVGENSPRKRFFCPARPEAQALHLH